MKFSKIEETHLQRLRHAGLWVSDPYPEGHSLEFGVRVAKPVETQGNSIPGFTSYCDDIKIDAPDLLLVSKTEGFCVYSQEHIPGPGPGDFTNVWPTAQEAIDDILDFYLGDPARMALKSKELEEGRRRLRDAQAEVE